MRASDLVGGVRACVGVPVRLELGPGLCLLRSLCHAKCLKVPGCGRCFTHIVEYMHSNQNHPRCPGGPGPPLSQDS